MNKLFILAFILISQIMFGQQIISGTIVDGQSNETLIGANIFIKETKKGASTDLQGNYQLETSLLQFTTCYFNNNIYRL